MNNHPASITIGKSVIGTGHPPFIIVEMSGNHNQSLDRALEIVDAAAVAGAHAIKLQTYTADTITLDIRVNEFAINDPESLWNGKNLYQLYKEAHTPWKWHKPIFERCHKAGICCFSSPFDASAVDLLESLDAPAYKIASFEIVDLPLIRRAAVTGKPLFMSTGMATVAEIDEAIRAARGAGCKELVLLKCTSSYPASPAMINLNTIPDMRSRFGVEVGLSDHTMGIGTAVAAVAHGAVAIEKHFTLSRKDGGVDSAFSCEPDELKTLIVETKNAWLAMGGVKYGPSDEDVSSLVYRRSLYAVKDIRAGEQLTIENVRSIRPGKGLSPKFYDEILGRKVNRDVSRGTPLDWDMIK